MTTPHPRAAGAHDSDSGSDTDTDHDSVPGALAPGTWLGRYQIVRLVGRGGMGCVYEAVHRDLGKRVAVKTLLPELAASPEPRSRFLREGQAASRIRHPNVVDVTDVGAAGPTIYLVMEYLEGEDLASLITRQGALPLSETADLMLPVMAAIAEAHGQGVIHRDLKPENVFLARSAQGANSWTTIPKVLDFGISKMLDDPTARALTGTSATFGTVYYLPPEQLRGAREADARSDQYALGTILYECVTGRRAFKGEGIYAILKAVAEGDYVPARTWRPDLPARLEAAIVRAMSTDPAARWPSVRDLGAALLEHASSSVRVLWTPAFARAPGEIWPPAAQAARTLILPSPRSSPSLTGSALDLVPRRSAIPLMGVVAAVAALAAAIGVARVRGRVTTTAEPADLAAPSAPSDLVAPAAASAASALPPGPSARESARAMEPPGAPGIGQPVARGPAVAPASGKAKPPHAKAPHRRALKGGSPRRLPAPRGVEPQSPPLWPLDDQPARAPLRTTAPILD